MVFAALTILLLAGFVQPESWLLTPYKNLVFVEFLMDVEVKSNIACGILANNEADVVAFVYKSNTGNCYLYPFRPTRTDDYNTVDSSTLYWKIVENCPSNYTLSTTNTCYYSYLVSGNQTSSKDICRADGGYLYIADTALKYNIVKDSIGAGNANYYYLGAKRINETYFEWGSGQRVNTYWNATPSQMANISCVAFHKNCQKFHDLSCTTSHFVMCEIPMMF